MLPIVPCAAVRVTLMPTTSGSASPLVAAASAPAGASVIEPSTEVRVTSAARERMRPARRSPVVSVRVTAPSTLTSMWPRPATSVKPTIAIRGVSMPTGPAGVVAALPWTSAITMLPPAVMPGVPVVANGVSPRSTV